MFLKAKITTPIIAVALVSATVFGVYTYNNNSDKTTAVKKHTSIYCHCHHKYTCDNYSASRHHCHDYYHKKREPDKAALASDIAEGAALAESKSPQSPPLQKK